MYCVLKLEEVRAQWKGVLRGTQAVERVVRQVLHLQQERLERALVELLHLAARHRRRRCHRRRRRGPAARGATCETES